MRTPTLCFAWIFALACTPKDDGSTAGETTTNASTDATSGDASTTGPSTTGPDAVTTGPDAVTTGPDAVTTGDGTTDAAEDSVCAALCAHRVECQDPFAEGCLEDCAAKRAIAAYPGDACLALQDEHFTCLTATTCEDLEDSSDACDAEFDLELSDACTSELCDAYAARLLECDFISEQSQIGRAYECTYFLAELGLTESAACLDAAEKVIACVPGATCEEIDAGEGCAAERQAQDEACG